MQILIHQIFCACSTWLWLGPLLAALQYVTDFRFCRFFPVMDAVAESDWLFSSRFLIVERISNELMFLNCCASDAFSVFCQIVVNSILVIHCIYLLKCVCYLLTTYGDFWM